MPVPRGSTRLNTKLTQNNHNLLLQFLLVLLKQVSHCLSCLLVHIYHLLIYRHHMGFQKVSPGLLLRLDRLRFPQFSLVHIYRR